MVLEMTEGTLSCVRQSLRRALDVAPYGQTMLLKQPMLLNGHDSVQYTATEGRPPFPSHRTWILGFSGLCLVGFLCP